MVDAHMACGPCVLADATSKITGTFNASFERFFPSLQKNSYRL